jgi:glyoxylase-like metal-dependent hydrolase (beta-lactamase superfamily II)
MCRFEKEVGNIYRLKIPFEDIYTSVFLIKSDRGALLVDCGQSREAVDEYIIPALRDEGYGISDIAALILTHRHGDHAGGLSRILELVPTLTVIAGEGEISPTVRVYPIPGHTRDSIGVLCADCRALITGDGVQGDGVGRYPMLVSDKAEYISSLVKIIADERIEALIFSHPYRPWGNHTVYGNKEICSCLSYCINKIKGEKQ